LGRDSTSLVDVFASFYGVTHIPTFSEVQSSGFEDYLKLSKTAYFNCPNYIRRIEISAETFLLEANDRGKVSKISLHFLVYILNNVLLNCRDQEKKFMLLLLVLV